jgi:hypothetical protein
MGHFGTFWDICPGRAAALLAVAVYAVTLGGTYVYDDVEIVRTDQRVLEPQLWGRLWTRPYFLGAADKLYRPLVSMSFAIENYLHGDRPWIFHLINVLLHAGVAAVVALLGVRLCGRAAGWIAGILFAAHPVHVEAVAGLVGRAETACALATLGAVLLFLRPGAIGIWRGVAIWLLFVVALLSKEHGILLPCFLLAAMPVRHAGLRIPGDERKSLQYLGIALCWTLAGYFIWREQVASLSWDRNQLDWYMNPMVRSVGSERVLMPLVLLGRYTQLLFFPLHLSIDYSGRTISWHASANDPYLFLGIAAAFVWGVGTFVSWRKRNWVMLFCLLGLAISYGMIGNIVALIGTIFADRLMYLPSAFFVLIAAIALPRFSPKLVAPIVTAAAVLGIARTYTYARLWNDPPALYAETVRVHPLCERGYALLWTVYQKREDYAAALAIAHRAKQADPDAWKPYEMCIQSNLGLGNFDAADRSADEALGHVVKGRRIMFLQWKDFIAQRREESRRH